MTQPSDEVARSLRRLIAELITDHEGGKPVDPDTMDPARALSYAWEIDRQATRVLYDTVREARGSGLTWHNIATLLWGRRNATAEDAFEYVATDDRFEWLCHTCHHTIADHGPYNVHPDDREHGHAPTCSRRRHTSSGN